MSDNINNGTNNGTNDNTNINIQGRINAPYGGANIDYLYGPWSDVEEAYSKLELADRHEEIGMTVGVNVNGKIEEFWLQQVEGERFPQLVQKTIGLTPATKYKLGGIRTTVENLPIDIGYFDTHIDADNQLHCVVPVFKGSAVGLVPRYNRGGSVQDQESMFLNAKGEWSTAFSGSNLDAPLYLSSRNKVSLGFSNSFTLNSSNNLSLKQASGITLGGIKAENWDSIPAGYSCYEAKLGNNDTVYYDPFVREQTTMWQDRLYVMIPNSSGEGTSYIAGTGIGIEGNQIYLLSAKPSVIGGVKADYITYEGSTEEGIAPITPESKGSMGITGGCIEVMKGRTDVSGTDPNKLYITTQQILSVTSHRNIIGQLSDIDITGYDPGTDYSLVFDSEYSRTTNEILVLKAGNYITIQGTVDSELHLEDVGSYSDSEFPATTYVLVKTAGNAKFYFHPYDYEIQQRDKGYLLKDTATVSKTDFVDSTHSDSDKVGMACDSGYYLLTIFGNILQIDKLADKRDID